MIGPGNFRFPTLAIRDENTVNLFHPKEMFCHVEIKLLDDGLEPPAYAHDGDAGLDLRSRFSTDLYPMERKLIPLGVSIAIPPMFVGYLHPRSGLAIKKGIGMVNSVGVIDSAYRGEICAELINLGSEPVSIKRGDRVAQLVLVPFVHADLHYVDGLDDTERGVGGFGSSGVD